MPILEYERLAPSPETSASQTATPSHWTLWFWQQARKIVIFVVGSTVLLLGLAGLLIPVLPGWVLIFAGLVILATEFAWARWMLRMAKQRASDLVTVAKRQVSKNPDPSPDSRG